MPKCPHAASTKLAAPTEDAKQGGVCPECVESGSDWVHLRQCLDCGHVGCCDSSPNTHARKHFERDSHPVIASFEPGEHWSYCYADDVTL